MAQRPWNYRSHVKCCTECEGTGWVRAVRRATIDDPYPESPCDNCSGEHEPECEVCGYDLPVEGYDCLACETVAALNESDLRKFDPAAFADAVAVAVGKALADSVKVAA